MSFLTPKTNLPDGLNDNTPGRQATQSPLQPIPLVFGVCKLAVQWVTPVLHWHYRTTKTSNYAFFSCYGWIALGPFDQIRQIHVNRKPYQGVYVQRSVVGDSPYVKTISKETPETFTFFWGTETEASKNSHLQGLVRTAGHAMAGAIYPADRGIFSVSLRDVEAGQVGQNGETPALPMVEIEAYRRSPKTYSFGHVDHGVNLAGAAYDLLTLKRGGAKIDPALLGDSWDAVIAKLNDTGVAGISGTDLFGSVVLAEKREAGDYLAEVLSYFDGHVVERNGKLEVDYMAADDTTTDPTGLTEIGEHEMGTDVDPTEDPDEPEDMATMVNVTGLDLEADPPLQEATEDAKVPGAARILGGDRNPISENRRFWVKRSQLKGAAQVIANHKALGQWKGTVPVLRQYAYQPDGTTPLRAGDRFTLDRADIGLDLVVRIIERSETDTQVVFKVVGERGAFPRPYEPTPDPRADLTAQPPADLERFAAAQLPPDLSDAADTHVAMLVERASQGTVGFDTHFSPDDVWPGQVIDTGNIRWAVAAVLQTTLGATLGDETITVDGVGDDWSYLQSRSTLEQADDQLLLWHGGEWMSVGTITSIGGGSYTLGIKRARLGSLAAAHAIADVVFIIPRNDLVHLTHASFAEVESGGVWDAGVATKYFKARPYTAVQGNLTASVSTVLRDPTPDQVTGLTVDMQGRAARLTWTAVAGALVEEYQVYRESWNGVSWDDDGKIGETTGADYPDLVPVFGNYRWRVRAVATDYTAGAFSIYAAATAAPTTAGEVDTTAPDTPAAPTYDDEGTGLSDDGTARAWVQVDVPALPTGAATIEILVREDGDTTWQVDEVDATPSGTHRINGLSVGVAYEIAARARSRFMVPSAVSVTLGRTAPGDTTTPTAPTGVTTRQATYQDSVAPRYTTSITGVQPAAIANWDAPADKDVAFAEYRLVTPNNVLPAADAAFNPDFKLPAHGTDLPIYLDSPSFFSSAFCLRFWDRSLNYSGWTSSGQVNWSADYAGTMGAQGADDVRATGLRIGDTGAPKVQVAKPINTVINTGAGGATVDVAIDISGVGMPWKPDKADIHVMSDDTHKVRYNWDHASNSASTAYVVVSRFDGAAVAASANIRISAEFKAGTGITI